MCSKDKKGILPDYNGALPQTPGFNALRTQAWFIKRGAVHYTLPPCFSHQIDARVASQQSPILRAGKNRILKMLKKRNIMVQLILSRQYG